MEKDVLATFKKHIGDIDFSQDVESKNLHIHNFGEDMKSINEFAGALQTLQICFGKILHLAHTLKQNPAHHTTIKAQIQEHIKECRFLGKGLFDSSMSAKVGMTIITLENPSPIPLLDKSATQDFIDYIQDKNTELIQTLNFISQTIASENPFTRDGTNNTASISVGFKDLDIESLKHKIKS